MTPAAPPAPRWVRAGDAAALAAVVAIHALGFLNWGLAGYGLARGAAWALCALLGAWGAWGWACGRLDGDDAAPLRWLARFFLAAAALASLQLAPLPLGLASANPLWREALAAFQDAGLAPPDSLPWALAPGRAALGWHQLAASALFVLGIAPMLTRRTVAARLLAVVVCASLLEGVLGLGSYALRGAERARGALFNPNHHAALAVMGIPLALAVCAQWHRRSTSNAPGPPVLALAALILAALVGWLAAFSRSSLVLGGGVLIAWALRERALWQRGRGAGAPQGSHAALAAAALLLLLTGAASLADRYASRFRELEGIERIDRVDMWFATLRGLRATNYGGMGIGGAEHALNRFATVPTATTAVFTHNDWVQWLGELGVPVCALLALLALRWFAAWIEARRDWSVRWSIREQMIRRAAAAGCAITLAHAATDFHLRIPLVGFQFLALLALTCSPALERVFPSPARGGAVD
ncbi:MAG: hypothetical protein SF028_05345 [Candidatus Sumerlaeia bacterium]|nr:hypothetical protein [Candidatus Sumerlaeia bacterium]